MKRKIKEVIQQQTALNYKQYINSSSDSVLTAAQVTTQVKAFEFLSVSEFTQAAYFNMLTAGAKNKHTIRSYFSRIWLTNSSNAPLYAHMWWVSPRKNGTWNIANIMADGYPAWNRPYLDPTVGNSFRRLFKIWKRRVRKIKAGDTITVSHKRFFRGNWQVQGQIEGEVQTPRTTYLIVKYFTGPQMNPNSVTGPWQGEFTVAWVQTGQLCWSDVSENTISPVEHGSAPTPPVSNTAITYTDVVEQTVDAGSG